MGESHAALEAAMRGNSGPLLAAGDDGEIRVVDKQATECQCLLRSDFFSENLSDCVFRADSRMNRVKLTITPLNFI